MKTIRYFRSLAQKTIITGIGLFLIADVGVKAVTLYDNSLNDTGNSLNFVNGSTMGNEIVLGNGFSSAILTNFSFEIYSSLATFTGPNVQMQVFLYANDGAPFNTYSTPGSVLYDSGIFALQTPQQYQGLNAVTLNFDLSSAPVAVNSSNFTFAAIVTGLDISDSVGFELFTDEPVGLNYGDYWINNGSGWALQTNSVPTSIGAVFEGVSAVPEPSTFGLGILGGSILMGMIWLRRRHQSKPSQPFAGSLDS